MKGKSILKLYVHVLPMQLLGILGVKYFLR